VTIEAPPRLKDGELGAIVRSAAGGGMSAERLARNGSRVHALIAAGAKATRWKLLLGLLFGALGVAVVALVVPRGDHATETVQVQAPPAPAADAALAAPADAAPAIAAIEPDAAPPVEPPHRRAAARATIVVDAGVVEHVAVDAAPTPSDLPEQIALYDQARAFASAGNFAAAIDRIDELLRRFPSTQLRSEAELTRADALARGGRLAEAAHAFEGLVRDDAHRGRRGELLRTLGDLYRRQGDCTRARDAYTRALAERLGERDRADAERGRDRCTSK